MFCVGFGFEGCCWYFSFRSCCSEGVRGLWRKSSRIVVVSFGEMRMIFCWVFSLMLVFWISISILKRRLKVGWIVVEGFVWCIVLVFF